MSLMSGRRAPLPSALLVLALGCGSNLHALDMDGDGFTGPGGDCVDAEEGRGGIPGDEINPGETGDPMGDGVDQNCDGALEYDFDGDGYDSDEHGGADCDDDDAAINPDAQEVCGGVDEDCDGLLDQEDTSIDLGEWYQDSDGDGWGQGTPATATSCDVPDNYSTLDGDCDDADAEIKPDAEELCDEVDWDCDGSADEGATDVIAWHPDADADGYGASDEVTVACEAPEGYVEDDLDCDDGDAEIHPGVTESCNDVDDDCNGDVDDDASDAQDFYADADDDGYGDPAILETSCEQPEGYVPEAGDCDDADSEVSPDAIEICDEIDNDCDAVVDDEGGLAPVDATSWYQDYDRDDYGNSAVSERRCDAPEGYVDEPGDCNDSDASIYPGTGLDEVCSDGDREDCDIDEATAREECIMASSSRLEADATRYGNAAGRELAETLASAGDVDGDGFADVLVAALGSGGGVYLLAGSLTRDVSAVDAATTYTARRTGGGSAMLGRGLVGGADLNGDDYDDVGMGAPENDDVETNAGIAYFEFGPLSGTSAASDADVSAAGSASGQYAGFALAMGEVGEDGQADLVVGAYGYESGSLSSAGAVYILLGPLSVADLSLGSDYDARITGDEDNDELGQVVAAIGDVDGDGAGDLWLGSPGNSDGGSGAGQAELLLGPITSGVAGDIASLTFRGGSGYSAGSALAGPGDVNGDGYADLLVAAPGYESDAGLVALFLGADETELLLTADEGDANAIFLGVAPSDALGTSTSGALDLEGDGLGDLALGVPGYDEGGSGAGAVWLVSGLSEGSITMESGEGALILGADNNEALGTGVVGLGDTDGDGWGDLAVSAPGYDASSYNDAGALFLFARWY